MQLPPMQSTQRQCGAAVAVCVTTAAPPTIVMAATSTSTTTAPRTKAGVGRRRSVQQSAMRARSVGGGDHGGVLVCEFLEDAEELLDAAAAHADHPMSMWYAYHKVRCLAHAANTVRNRVCVQSVCYASHRKKTRTQFHFCII